ncbi:tRNA uridine-5-carboxymethylaminomethyl(34) synthesis GTPase MnmE [Consotaella aegiceratis]|uniref:tRNA uridine-5-carboxymethylaminomethyl(34) synthesis GTPase MnmE n=1 Tax=Consotaella aegiceratis TaxID=3097961 RepID=UPI002F3E709E
MEEETIVALSSGSLPAGIAVVRISGPKAGLVLAALAGKLPEPRRASLRRIRNIAGATIDHGLVLFFPGPGSVTGEDLAEIHLHGGRAVVDACVMAATTLPDVRLAEAGEFTRRAFENGRLDLTEAEGLADLLSAQTEAQRAAAVAQSDGVLRDLYEGWMRRLTHARAMLEASFDFADEGDVGEGVAASVHGETQSLAEEMRRHLAGAQRGEIVRSGFRVAIAGRPNVGKSSLLNALALRDVAIVSDVPGTTRDVLEVMLDLGGLPVRIFDTAGLRETGDRIEALGMDRARQAIDQAHLVLLLDDGLGADPQDIGLTHVKHGERQTSDPTSIRIRSKSDLAAESAPGRFFDMAISTKTGEGLQPLVDRIAALAAEAVGDAGDLIPLRLRHRDIVADALHQLDTVLSEPEQPEEIAAETLRRVSDRLGALTGRVGVEDVLDVIFGEFCIGK